MGMSGSVQLPHKIITTVGQGSGVYWLTSLDDFKAEADAEVLNHAYAVASSYSRRRKGEQPDERHPSDAWLLERGLRVIKGKYRR